MTTVEWVLLIAVLAVWCSLPVVRYELRRRRRAARAERPRRVAVDGAPTPARSQRFALRADGIKARFEFGHDLGDWPHVEMLNQEFCPLVADVEYEPGVVAVRFPVAPPAGRIYYLVLIG